jgi:hypothetical protein
MTDVKAVYKQTGQKKQKQYAHRSTSFVQKCGLRHIFVDRNSKLTALTNIL